MGYSIKFEKSKDYKRFNMHHIIAEANRFGEFTIEFYEDIENTVESVIYDDHGGSQVQSNEYNAVRTIHAGATLHVTRIPDLISALQEKLNAYYNYVNSQHNGENDGKS